MSTTMRTRRAAAVGLFALGVLAGPAVRAEDPEGSVWLWFRPGWAYTSLDRANDLIDAGNATFAEFDLAGMDPFHNTFYVGADLHANLHRRMTAYVGYGSVFGSEQKSFNRVVETKVSSTAISGGLLYRVPWPGGWEEPLDDLDLFVGGGALYLANFEFTSSDEDRTTAREFLEERIFSGDGLGFEVRMSAEYFLSPKFTLMGGATYRLLSLGDLAHDVRVSNPNAFNPLGDDDGDGIANQNDPDYTGDMFGRAGNAQRMYGRFVPDPENPGEQIWQAPQDRYLASLYIYDENSYFGAPDDVHVYDPSARFDLDMSGVSVQLGLTYYIF